MEIDEVLGPMPEQPATPAQWWLLRGRVEETTGLSDRAVASFEQAVALETDGREAHFRLGAALEEAGAKRAGEDPPRPGEPDRPADQGGSQREHQALRRGGIAEGRGAL